MPPIVPPTGLIGSEQAIRQGLLGSLTSVGQGVGSAQGEIDLATAQARGDLSQGAVQATQPLSGFTQQGQQASQQQAALSGALGPEAQAQAFQGFQSSPGQQFLQQEAERSVLRNAAATGGLGGGNVLRELQKQAVGLAQQDFSNQFGRLGDVANRGFTSAGAESGIQERLGQGLGNVAMQGGRDLSNLAFQGGVLPAQLIGGAAGDISQQRFGTGQQIAQAAGGTAANLANLQNQLGGQFAGVAGQGATNLANLVSGTGQASSQLNQQLASILANIGTGTGSALAQPTQLAGQFDSAGILGQNTSVQNALQQLIQLIPQGGGANTGGSFQGGGSGNASFNAGAIA